MTDDSIHEFVIARLQASKGKWPSIAEASTVPYATLRKIATREVPNPGVVHIEKLARYFRAADAPQAA